MAKKAAKKVKAVKNTAEPLTGEEEQVSARNEPVDDEVTNVFASQNHFQHFVWRSLVDSKEQLSSINENLGGLIKLMSDVQGQINEVQAELTTIASDLESEFSALESQVAAGTPVNLDGLKAIVDRLNSDDAAWKQPAAPASGGGTTPTP